MLNVGENRAEKIGVKMAILVGSVFVEWNGEISGTPVL